MAGPAPPQKTEGPETSKSPASGGGNAGRSRAPAGLKGMTFAEGQEALAPAPAGTPAVSVADRSSFERWVQSSLNGVAAAFGTPCGGVEVNGSLRGPTRSAVRGFQRNAKKLPGGHRLAVDGIVGQHTTATLEGVTSSTAPTTSEVQRKRKNAANAKTEEEPSAAADKLAAAGGAAAGGAAAGGAGAAPKKEAEPAAQAGKKPVEDPKKVDAAAKDEAKKPPSKRGGAAGVADELRERFPKGVLVALTIPKAFDSVEDAYNEAKEHGFHHVDGYAYRVQFPHWAKGHVGTIQTVWHDLRKNMGRRGKRLPEQFTGTGSKANRRILSAIKASGNWNAMRRAMFGDDATLRAMAKTAYGNNKYIPDSAAGFAKRQGAVAAKGGGLAFGKSMIYHKKSEIAPLVTGASGAVAQALSATPPADGAKEGQAEKDAAIAKVRFVSISAHGSSKWMGGHGKASKANMTKRDVPAIVAGMAGVLASDVRVRLFACHTSKQRKHDDQGEGTIADVFRDELAKAGKTKGGVIGHRESGDTQRNSTTRFFGAGQTKGAHDWGYTDVFTETYIHGFLHDRGAWSRANAKALKTRTRDFFGREGWMEEIGSLEALRKSVRARWEKKYPDAKSLRKLKGVHVRRRRKRKRRRKRRKSR